LAAALIYYERPDIIVHAIEPSPFKCDYIDILRKANRLSNVRIIQAGLSDKAVLFTYAPIVDGLHKSGVVWGSNTGGTTWVPFENVDMPPKLHLTDWKPPTPQNPELSPEVIHFTTLDLLVENGTIPEKILAIHLDVEDMEQEAVTGAMDAIQRDLPYLSIEERVEEQLPDGGSIKIKNRILQLLPDSYKLIGRTGQNICFLHSGGG